MDRADLIERRDLNTAAEFMAEIQAMCESSSPVRVFRGQADADWALESKVCRTKWAEYLPPNMVAASTIDRSRRPDSPRARR